MRYFILCFFIFIYSFSYAQYPITDNFNSIGAVSEWYIDNSVPYYSINMGLDAGNLCYNLGGVSYIKNVWYSFHSPNYNSKFQNQCTDSLTITFGIINNIRTNDNLKLWRYDGSFWYSTTIPKSSTYITYTIKRPKTTQLFTFDLITENSNTNISGKYVHIDYFTINCTPIHNLPVELTSFIGVVGNKLTWEVESQKNNDYYLIDHSINGIDWNNISIVNNDESTNFYTIYDYSYRDTINYYRLSQIDIDGHRRTYNEMIVSIDNRNNKIRFVVKMINTLGQDVDLSYDGIIILIYNDNTITKIINKIL